MQGWIQKINRRTPVFCSYWEAEKPTSDDQQGHLQFQEEWYMRTPVVESIDRVVFASCITDTPSD